jgi:aminopeptidase N
MSHDHTHSPHSHDHRVLLPSNVKPDLYQVHLTPDFKTLTFDGNESIHLIVNEPSKSITLNALEIVIHSASVKCGDVKQSCTFEYDTQNEYVIFKFENEITNNAVLDIHFEGILNDKLAGFYKSTYKVGDEDVVIGTTQFEPVDGRRAFPMWDEPAVKARFEITLTVPHDYIALSNMPEIDEIKNEDGSKTVKFDTTPVVSSYLVAFVVGKFEFVEGVTENGIKFRVFTTPGKLHLGTFALDVGIKVLTYFEKYYDIPYPLPKQDMIAIPDFSMGAMENWGLITYRETALLCDPDNASVAAKSRVAYVIAHELAHQWFGNIVTMEWWSELWLNEGFATFVGNQAVHAFFPEWEIWTQFISDYIFRAFTADGLKNSHPIEVPVRVAREIDEIFDAISYCKGASVIRMIENFLGEENFRKGLNIYLNRHKYGNAITTDLWQALSEGSGVDVAKWMQNWVTKIGYPVLSVTETDKPGILSVHQQRFLSSGPPSEEEDTTVWNINLGYVTDNSSEIKYSSLEERSAEIDVGTEGWVKINAGQGGFYRVKYSPHLNHKLGEAIAANQISGRDRLGIVNDSFSLAQAGLIKLTQALDLVQHFSDEEDYTVWSNISENLNIVSALFGQEEFHAQYKQQVLNLYQKIGEKLGWEAKSGESDLTKLLRPIVLGQLGGNGDDMVVEEGKRRFNEYVNDRSSCPPDLLGVVLRLAMRNGGEEEFDKVVKLYEEADQPEVKIKCLVGIGLSKEEALIHRALEYSLTDKVRTQDVIYVFHATATTVKGREITWTWVKNNWEKLFEMLSASLLARTVSYSTAGFTTREKADEVREFFADKREKAPFIERTVDQSIETILSNAGYVERELENLREWLTSKH